MGMSEDIGLYQLAAGYSINNHISVLATAAAGASDDSLLFRRREPETGYYLDVGAGLYKHFQNGVYLAANGGFGYGWINYDMIDSSISQFRFNKYFLSTDFAYSHKWFSCAFTNKISFLQYLTSGKHQADPIHTCSYELPEKRLYYLTEPSLLVGLGVADHFYFYWYHTWSKDLIYIPFDFNQHMYGFQLLVRF
jgi:hypothetical protein